MSVAESPHLEAKTIPPIARAYRVTYEDAPAYRVVAGERRAVGFELTLSGTPAQPVQGFSPMSVHCLEVLDGLHRIARALLPACDASSRCRLRAFDHAFHMSAARAFRSDIQVVVEIRHPRHHLRPVDDEERRALDEMKRRLARYGVPHQVWRA
jgi:hypothetical protein